jgi:CheY-like chemotaxis protein
VFSAASSTGRSVAEARNADTRDSGLAGGGISRKTVLLSLAPPSVCGWHPIALRAAFGDGKVWRILLVDDNEPVRRSVETLLHSHKDWFVCGEASDGLQAVAEAKSLRPDLIIMDVSMPNMNGLEATRVILREVRESRVLIISQNDPAIVRRQAVEAHALGFVEKSNIQRDLIAAVECILSGNGQSKAEKAS